MMYTGVNNRHFPVSRASYNTSGRPPGCSSWLNQICWRQKEWRILLLTDRWSMSEIWKGHYVNVTSSSVVTRWAALSQKTPFKFSPSRLFPQEQSLTEAMHSFHSVWETLQLHLEHLFDVLMEFFLTRVRSVQFEKLENLSLHSWIFWSCCLDNFTKCCLRSLINITVN